jgi:hypothetical protein
MNESRCDERLNARSQLNKKSQSGIFFFVGRCSASSETSLTRPTGQPRIPQKRTVQSANFENERSAVHISGAGCVGRGVPCVS